MDLATPIPLPCHLSGSSAQAASSPLGKDYRQGGEKSPSGAGARSCVSSSPHQSPEDTELLKGSLLCPSPESSPPSSSPGFFSAALTGPNCRGEVRN